MGAAVSEKRPVRPWLVGTFVLGAAGLALAAVAVLSSGHFFESYRRYVIFFPHAVGSLKEGSPVTFREVPIGRVRDVELVFVGSEFTDSRIMALVEIRREAVRNLAAADSVQHVSDADLLSTLVKAGLRASVRSSSPIAGQRSVDLDLHPELQPRYSGFTSPYPEIPTAPTGMELLNEKIEATMKRISEVPLDDVLLQLRTTLVSLQRVLDGHDLEGSLSSLRRTLDTANRTLATGEKTLGTVDGMATDARTTLARVDATMKGLQKTLDEMNRTLATVDRNVERSADVQHEGAKAFEELGELLKTLRSLVDTLERHPESLLRGKPEPEGRK
jgi:paraquat-inducible protein B